MAHQSVLHELRRDPKTDGSSEHGLQKHYCADQMTTIGLKLDVLLMSGSTALDALSPCKCILRYRARMQVLSNLEC